VRARTRGPGTTLRRWTVERDALVRQPTVTDGGLVGVGAVSNYRPDDGLGPGSTSRGHAVPGLPGPVQASRDHGGPGQAGPCGCGSFIMRAPEVRHVRCMVDRLSEQVEKERRDQQVLRAVIERGPVGINSLAREMDLPEHKVRYSLRMLENDDLVEPTPDGAVPVDDIADRIDARNDGIDDLVDRLKDLKEVL